MAKKKRLTFLISAGPTIEAIDPVRYLSNRSTGKMGYSIANAAIKLGHKVILVSGPTHLPPPKGSKVISIESAREMKKAMESYFSKADIIIKAAAVADYRPYKQAKQKIKKTNEILNIKLVKNPDIAKILGKKKKKNQILIGFAAETNNTVQNAKKKLIRKNMDAIVLNDVSQKGIGFKSNDNEILILTKEQQLFYKKQSKASLGRKLVSFSLNLFEKI